MAYISSRVTFSNVPIDKLKVAMVSPMPSSQVLKEEGQDGAEAQNAQSPNSSADRITKFKSGKSCDICGKYFKQKWVLRNHMTNDHDRKYNYKGELYRYVNKIYFYQLSI